METLDTLLLDVRACTACEANLPFGPRPIVQADARAKILIAGQAPGRRVHESGKPFDDPSGVRLREWLGIDDEVFYKPEKIALLPMGFCYPGTGKSGDLPPRPECADLWRARLLKQLPNIELLLLLGKYAQDDHFGKPQRSLTSRVQNWRETWPDVLPLPHPSPRNNIWLRRNPWFELEVLPQLKTRIHSLLGQ
jgi:uracil-DNA glycosylase